MVDSSIVDSSVRMLDVRPEDAPAQPQLPTVPTPGTPPPEGATPGKSEPQNRSGLRNASLLKRTGDQNPYRGGVPPADADAYTFVDDSAVTAWEEWTIRQRFTVGIALLAVAVVMFGALTPLGDSDKQTPTSIPFSRPPAFPLPLTQTRSDAPFTDEAKATVARAIERTRARGTAYYEHFAVVEGWRSVNGDGPCLGANTVRLSDGDVHFGAFALRRIGGTNRTAESIVTPHHVCSRRTGADGVAGPWYYAAPLETDSLVALRQFGSEPRFLNEWNNALPTASLVGLVGPDSIAQRLDADLVDGADVTRAGASDPGGPSRRKQRPNGPSRWCRSIPRAWSGKSLCIASTCGRTAPPRRPKAGFTPRSTSSISAPFPALHPSSSLISPQASRFRARTRGSSTTRSGPTRPPPFEIDPPVAEPRR